ncbi:hypothetical protein EAY64_07230 [Aquitalea palustris]|uniref:Uncharacterized protein n=1 Tax=Aquitalea palustris TaxID=2480983 RepID=A0A454JJY5_9NEIS|nr:hypothetical protein [Aquitalea palustris]RMC99558.1 hypothetical protein EAY64_07230 [Aquitalea palustris]
MNANRYAQFFALDGQVIPIRAGLKVNQTYEQLGGRQLFRARTGKARLQSHWSKVKTVLSGSGWHVMPFAGIDQTAVHTLDCVTARALQGHLPLFTLPAIRQDIPPRGFAVVGGELVPTHAVLAGTVLTLNPVANADSYVCWYWPRLTGYLTAVSDQGDPRSLNYTWSLTLEEA